MKRSVYRKLNKQGLRCGFVGVGRSTFDLKSAGEFMSQSIEVLSRLCDSVVTHPSLITNLDEATVAIDRMRDEIDVLVAQFNTFVDSRWMEHLAGGLNVPILLGSSLVGMG